MMGMGNPTAGGMGMGMGGMGMGDPNLMAMMGVPPSPLAQMGPQTRVLKLTNMVSEEELADNEEYDLPCLPACLPACLLACLPACLPICLSAYWPSYQPSKRPTYPPTYPLILFYTTATRLHELASSTCLNRPTYPPVGTMAS
jgi:hypothetical protein